MKNTTALKIQWIGLLVLLMVVAGTATFNIFKSKNSLPIQNACLDLSSWNRQNVVSLSGNWEFYWEKFITYNDLKSGDKPDLIQNVPEVWNNYRINQKKLPSFGYGTYRLKVTKVDSGQPIALWIPTVSTAYRLYIDNTLIASSGKVSNIQSENIPQYLPQQIVFTPKSSTFNIILQVSNYTYARGGMWYALYLGTPKQIFDIARGTLSRDLLILGSLFVMIFIYSSIFIFRKKEKSNLFFAVLCFISACRTLLHGSYLLNVILPFLSFKFFICLDYMVLFWFPVVLTALLNELYPFEFQSKIIKFFFCYAALMSALIFLTPVSFFTNSVYFAELIFLVVSVYIYTEMSLAIIHHREHAALLLTGCIILLVGATYDVMYQNSIITTGFFELTPICFFLLMLMQAFVLAKNFTITLQKNEEALNQLQISSERERRTELMFLRSQIRPHFIHNALNTIISVSRKDMPLARNLLMEFSNYLRGCFDFKDLEDLVPLENELDFVRSYVILEQARFGETLRVQYDIDKENILVPPLILQPLVENAVVHGIRPKQEGGLILIYVKQNSGTIRIGVQDDGTGIEQEKINRLLSGKDTTRGVGIFNISRRLNRMYGTSLAIKNMQNGGLDVSMELPLEGGNRNDSGSAD